jgi:hypothetical protein
MSVVAYLNISASATARTAGFCASCALAVSACSALTNNQTRAGGAHASGSATSTASPRATSTETVVVNYRPDRPEVHVTLRLGGALILRLPGDGNNWMRPLLTGSGLTEERVTRTKPGALDARYRASGRGTAYIYSSRPSFGSRDGGSVRVTAMIVAA